MSTPSFQNCTLHHGDNLRLLRVTVPLLPLLCVPVLFMTDSPAWADCKYKFGTTGECAPIQSLSIDCIDFEIVATDRTYSDGTVNPACLGRLYIEGGNVAQFANLDQAITVRFRDASARKHLMTQSTLRPGALGRVQWIVEYRSGSFEYLGSDELSRLQPNSRKWWVESYEDHQTIPVSLILWRTYDANYNRREQVGYEKVLIPLPHVLLGFDAALAECKKELIARSDRKVQDFVHRENIATAEAKIAGAKARKEYYES